MQEEVIRLGGGKKKPFHGQSHGAVARRRQFKSVLDVRGLFFGLPGHGS